MFTYFTFETDEFSENCSIVKLHVNFLDYV